MGFSKTTEKQRDEDLLEESSAVVPAEPGAAAEADKPEMSATFARRVAAESLAENIAAVRQGRLPSLRLAQSVGEAQFVDTITRETIDEAEAYGRDRFGGIASDLFPALSPLEAAGASTGMRGREDLIVKLAQLKDKTDGR